MNLEWYRTFVMVYRFGTATAAAQQIAMTQPAVSQQIAALEQSLGTVLFERTPRHMKPTTDGQELYNLVAGSVDQLDRVLSTIQLSDRQAQVVLRIGAPHDFFHVDGLQVLSQTAERPYRLLLQYGQTDELLAQLEDDTLDAVIASQRLAGTRFQYMPLVIEQFALITQADQDVPLLTSKTERQTWLLQQPWISYGLELPIIRRYWQSEFGERPPIQPQMVMPSLSSIVRAVGLGLGISIVPEYLLANDDNIQVFWRPEQKVSNQIYLVCRRERLREAPFGWLLGVLAQISDE